MIDKRNRSNPIASLGAVQRSPKNTTHLFSSLIGFNKLVRILHDLLTLAFISAVGSWWPHLVAVFHLHVVSSSIARRPVVYDDKLPTSADDSGPSWLPVRHGRKTDDDTTASRPANLPVWFPARLGWGASFRHLGFSSSDQLLLSLTESWPGRLATIREKQRRELIDEWKWEVQIEQRQEAASRWHFCQQLMNRLHCVACKPNLRSRQ